MQKQQANSMKITLKHTIFADAYSDSLENTMTPNYQKHRIDSKKVFKSRLSPTSLRNFVNSLIFWLNFNKNIQTEKNDLVQKPRKIDAVNGALKRNAEKELR